MPPRLFRPPCSWLFLLTVLACGEPPDVGATGAGESASSGDAPTTGAVDPQAVIYHEDVRPVLARHCVGCHRDGGVAPFALEPDDLLTITCRYDTTSRTEPTLWGEGTMDEMCVAGLSVTDV